MTGIPTAEGTASGQVAPGLRREAGPVPAADATAEQTPLAPLTLAPVPGLEGIGRDAVGFCGPDGC